MIKDKDVFWRLGKIIMLLVVFCMLYWKMEICFNDSFGLEYGKFWV